MVCYLAECHKEISVPKLIQNLLFYILLFALPVMSSATEISTECQDVWRIDLYAVAHQPDCERYFSRLKFFRWQDNRWKISDAETFFVTQQPDVPLIIFAPGYDSPTDQTTKLGFDIVRNFEPDKPCRVVFWDWYSDRGNGGIRCDIRSKLPIVQNTACYMTQFLKQLKPQSKTCLFGFSFGSRIVCQAVESLRKNDMKPEGLRLHLVLSGAATDQFWFAKGQQHSRIPEIAEKILVTYNPDDWALRFYPLMYNFRNRARALGYEGLPMRYIPPEYRDQFENINVNRFIGNEHTTMLHVQSPVFRNRIGTYFFFE